MLGNPELHVVVAERSSLRDLHPVLAKEQLDIEGVELEEVVARAVGFLDCAPQPRGEVVVAVVPRKPSIALTTSGAYGKAQTAALD